jgi:hypothetical protein
MTKNLKIYLDKFNLLLDQFETKIPYYRLQDNTISRVSIGWHIEHTLMSFNEYADLLSKSNPEEYKWRFNFIRNIVLITKMIPRGFGKSPETLLPKTHIDDKILTKLISDTRKNIKKFENLSQDAFLEHPVFGQLILMQTVNFLDTHAKHHLEIIDDIIKQNK